MPETTRIRRAPPPYREVAVARVAPVTRWLTRITLEGPGVEAMEPAGVAASLRLLVPGPEGPVLPDWDGNEFLYADGSRPVIRTLTPLDRDGDRLDVEVVLHGEGPLSAWARRVSPGDRAAVSGPGRPSAPDPGAPAYSILGDEAAVPAIGQVLRHLVSGGPVEVLIETGYPDDPAPLPDRDDATVSWLPRSAVPGAALVEAAGRVAFPEGTRVWAAGEAAAMHRIRGLLRDRAIPRTHATVRGYWKHGKPSGASGG